MVNVCSWWEMSNPNTGEALKVVSAQTAKLAFHLMRDFFIPHSVKLYETYFATGNQVFQDARWLADHILVNRLPKVSHSMLTKTKKEWREDKKRRDCAVQVLVEGRWLTLGESRNGQPLWMVNPMVHERFAEHTERERVERETREGWISASRRTLDKEYNNG